MLSFFVSLIVLFGLFIGLFFLFLFISSKVTDRPNQLFKQDKDRFFHGLVIVFLSHIAYSILVVLICSLVAFLWRDDSNTSLGAAILAVALLFFIWLAQLVYVVPLAIFFKTKGKQNTFQGIMVAAGVTFLLGSGICAVTTLGGR